MVDAVFVQGDTAPAMVAQLLKSDGTPRLLSDVAEVRFQMRRSSGTKYTVDAVGEITNASTGMVRYQWATTDLAVAADDYVAQWQLIYNGIALVNEDGDWTIEVIDNVVTVETPAAHGLLTSDSINTSGDWTVNTFMADLVVVPILSVPSPTTFTFALEQADQGATVETSVTAAITSTGKVQTTTPVNLIEVRRQ